MRDLDANNPAAVRTRNEVAQILTARGEPITRSGVWEVEQTALAKLRRRLADLARPERTHEPFSPR